MRGAWLIAMVVSASACAAEPDLDEPQDADEAGGGKQDSPQSCAKIACGNALAANILFPGNPACANGGCERGLAAIDLYIPPRNGAPWGDTYTLGSQAPNAISGYSSGRIALLRRLALANDAQHAILLDPSWDDGARNFTGTGAQRGEDIVQAWLRADPTRTFLLIYSTRSVGWSTYKALQTRDIGDRVKVCHVSEPHLLVPTVPDLHDALTDPDSWDNGTCSWGVSSVE